MWTYPYRVLIPQSFTHLTYFTITAISCKFARHQRQFTCRVSRCLSNLFSAEKAINCKLFFHAFMLSIYMYLYKISSFSNKQHSREATAYQTLKLNRIRSLVWFTNRVTLLWLFYFRWNNFTCVMVHILKYALFEILLEILHISPLWNGNDFKNHNKNNFGDIVTFSL